MLGHVRNFKCTLPWARMVLRPNRFVTHLLNCIRQRCYGRGDGGAAGAVNSSLSSLNSLFTESREFGKPGQTSTPITLDMPCLPPEEPDSTTMYTTVDYLASDPDAVQALVPQEVNLHRAFVMRDLQGHKRPDIGQLRKINSHVLVVAGADAVKGRVFKQHNEFLYLCDCLRPSVVLILIQTRKIERYTVLCVQLPAQALTNEQEQLLCRQHNVNKVVPLTQFRDVLRNWVRDLDAALWHHRQPNSKVSQEVDVVAEDLGRKICSPRHVIQFTRAFKTGREINTLRRANLIASLSLQDVMAQHGQLHMEDQLAALFTYKCQLRHAHLAPYQPKVLGGPCCTGLWLMNAGCVYGGYCGTLARTWPITGSFTPAQKLLYELLLQLRREMRVLLVEGTVERSPKQLHAAYLSALARRLCQTGVLHGLELTPAQAYVAATQINCSPLVAKHIGLDAREMCDKLLNYPFMPGNVVTLEQSICIPDHNNLILPEFRGLLCTLSDNIIIKEYYELEVLTADCVSDASAVEALRTKARLPLPRPLDSRDLPATLEPVINV